jgi:tetratricopeptide (TPR) repeat protein
MQDPILATHHQRHHLVRGNRRSSMRINRLAMLVATAALALIFAATDIVLAVESTTPSPPTPSTSSSGSTTKSTTKKAKKTKKPQQNSEQDFYDGYRHAHALIYDRGDYAGGIVKLRSLEQDNHPDVANMLGYASRKLGRYDDAKYWYEKALAADPNHALTWSYYGAWHAEQGNLLKARDYLTKVQSICGECREYTLLKGVIDGTHIY